MSSREFRPGEPWDLALWNWFVDYADPFDYINTQFTAGADHPAGFHDPRFERRMAAASRLRGDARLRAYAELDRDLAEQAAPQATFASGETSYFLSAPHGLPGASSDIRLRLCCTVRQGRRRHGLTRAT